MAAKDSEEKILEHQIPIEILHKEIDLVQDVISRMARNTFFIKGWMITLVSIIMIVAKEELLNSNFTYISPLLIAIVLFFWYLDAFFLHKERCYIRLYSWVVDNRNNRSRDLYKIDYRPFAKKENPVAIVMWANTLWPFYLSPIILIFVLMYVL